MAGPRKNVASGPQLTDVGGREKLERTTTANTPTVERINAVVREKGFNLSGLFPDGSAVARRQRAERGLAEVQGEWQLDLYQAGVYAQGVEALRQCIYIILTSRPGSHPFKPSFGSGIFDLLDLPRPQVKAALDRTIRDDLKTWEPRIEVLKVTTALTDSLGSTTGKFSGLVVEIHWRPLYTASVTQINSVLVEPSTTAVAGVGPGVFPILATESNLAILTEDGKFILV